MIPFPSFSMAPPGRRRLAIACSSFVALSTPAAQQPTVRPASAKPDLVTPSSQSLVPADSPAWHPANHGRIMTRWAAEVSPSNALPEYPRPQMTRPRWTNLNGLWQLAIVTDSTDEPPFGRALADHILVPYAMESALSGVGKHAERIVYRRTFTVPAEMKRGERLLLHFGAVDWRATVYVNGTRVGEHTGGYDAFTLDITKALRPSGAQELVVAVYDPTDAFGQPRGKQVSNPRDIWYTPVTGIWQTVWLEPVPAASIDRLVMTPDVAAGALRLTVDGRGVSSGARVEAIATANGKVVGRASGVVGRELRVAVPHAHLWSPDDPYLYDLRVVLVDGMRRDSVDSYFGMRTVGVTHDPRGFARIALNGKPVLQLGPLDQGWWPDGLYTPPTDAAMRADLETMKALGFNMVRKHIKVEPARWYYYADRLGLAVWQDMPSGWNDTPAARADFERELHAMVEQLRSTTSIVVWVPFNEQWGEFDAKRIAEVVKRLDPSRLVDDASGWQDEGGGEIIDVHRYQGPQAMYGTRSRVAVVGEFGGLGYKVAGHTWAGEGWGYSGLFDSERALADRYDLLVKRLYHDRDTHGIGAGVYTQLTDVEVELNGFMTYDRAVMKLDTARVAAVNRGLAPYVLPELDEFTDSVRVSVTSGAPVVIRYTTDGSEPTASSALYLAPFTVHANTTVRARSFVDGVATHAPEGRVDYRRVAGRAPVAAAPTSAMAPGLAYDYFADTTKEPPFRLNWPVRWRVEHPDTRPGDLKPTKTGTVATFSLAPADTTEMFSIRYRGYIRVPRTGVYTFTALSDDGAALWIGDTPVFGSLGQSPKTTETSGQIALQAGVHPITVGYFQAYGPMQLELFVAGPGLARRLVPATMLFRDRASTGRADASSRSR